MDISMDVYTRSDVMQLTGATARQIDHWATTDILPHAKLVHARRRNYSWQDVRVAWVLTRVSNIFGGLPFNRDLVEAISGAALLGRIGVKYSDIEIIWGHIPDFKRGI